MAAFDVEQFMASTHVSQPLERTISLTGFYSLPSSWQIDTDKMYLYGEGHDSRLGSQWIAIDTENSEIYVVYFITTVA
jgi:hypothetical protein